MGTEGITLHKAGVCEAKNAKHRLLLNNESMQQTTGAEGKALKLYGGLRETLHKPQIARQSTNNSATG